MSRPLAKLRQSLVKRLFRARITRRTTAALFHRSWYYSPGTWHDVRWLDTPALKCPLDLWIYQELIHELRPALIIETGTNRGGSASYLGSICELIGSGRVLTIDIADLTAGQPGHPRVEYLLGDSTAEDVVATARRRAERESPVMVILDSDHSARHVGRELQCYAPLVTPGSYLIVEDTNLNGHPVQAAHGPGPREAVDRFLTDNPGFERVPECERFLMTFNPGGYLRRVPAAGDSA